MKHPTDGPRPAPCPVCGREPHVVRLAIEHWRAQCEDTPDPALHEAEHFVVGPRGNTWLHAVERWNHRYETKGAAR